MCRRSFLVAIATGALLAGLVSGSAVPPAAVKAAAAGGGAGVFRMDLAQEPPSMDPQGTTLPEALLFNDRHVRRPVHVPGRPHGSDP